MCKLELNNAIEFLTGYFETVNGHVYCVLINLNNRLQSLACIGTHLVNFFTVATVMAIKHGEPDKQNSF